MRPTQKLIGLLGALLILAACNEFTPPSGQTTRYEDDFTATNVDTTAWHIGFHGNGTTDLTPPENGAMVQCYDPTQVTESNSQLHLKLSYTPNNPCTPAWTCGGCPTSFNWRAGHVDMRLPANGHTLSTGKPAHFEASIRMPASGTSFLDWGAFYVGADCWPDSGEYDIAEVLATNAATSSAHWGSGNPCGSAETKTSPKAGLTTNDGGFHKYSVDLTAGTNSCTNSKTPIRSVFAVDGNSYNTIDTCISLTATTDSTTAGWHISLELACGNGVGSTCVDNTIMDVEYVAVSTP